MRLLKENGLRSITFMCVYSEVKKYPREEAAHVALRTVRRFLEHWGEGVETVVFALENDEDMAIYERIFPLYFPRNSVEEKEAALKVACVIEFSATEGSAERLDNLGAALLRAGRRGEARDAFERALVMNPGDERARRGAAEARR